jgi:predicted P-loop ATPase
MARPKLDFDRIAQAALQQAEQLLGEWLPEGRRDGHEWKALNPTRGDSAIGSFSVNINTGRWADFATGDKGGDLVSLYAYLFTPGEQGKAARELAERLGVAMEDVKPRGAKDAPGGAAAPTQSGPSAKARSAWQPILPAPADAGAPPVAHYARGRPEHTWCYRDAEGRVLGHVYRFRTSDGGKEVLPVCWARHAQTGAEEWRWLAFPEPRPLYGLDRLAAAPGMDVLVVEGEKCAEAATRELPGYVAICWPGGGKAVGKADWSALAGRRVTIWPDCDAQLDKAGQLLPEERQPGTMAAEAVAAALAKHGCDITLVRIPKPGAVVAGWDIADAIAEGMTGQALADYIAARRAPPAVSAAKTAPRPGKAAAEDKDDWRAKLLWKKGELVACLANIFDILSHSSEWDGVVAFDEFQQATMKRKPPPWPGATVGEWDDNDDAMAAMWLTRHFDIAPSSKMTLEAIETLARRHAFHPVRDWLRSLPAWDGEERLRTWISDCLGAENTEYTQRAGRWYLMGMVARVMQPGVKFDYCLVLEGAQGKKKSAALEALAGEWFGDTDLDLHNKDSMLALRGKWLYEFAEMGSVTRAETTKQKSFLSRRVDEFRPAYGRRQVRCPRQVVFAGTTNDWEWNKDPTGGRRFWPIDCASELDLETLRKQRPQLFAEALAAWEAGERFWPSPEEQKAIFDPQQLLREQPESLVDALHDWVFDQIKEFSVAHAVMDGLKLDASKLTRDLQTRVGVALRRLGCAKVERRNGMVRYWYKPPKKAATSGESSGIPVHEEIDHAPF